MKKVFAVAVVSLVFIFAVAQKPEVKGSKGHRTPGWRSDLAKRLRTMGHRNWVVVADSAYPEQSRPGILTIDTGMDHMAVLKAVMSEIGRCKHVRPVVYEDAELKFVPEARAHGVSAYRSALAKMLKGRDVAHVPHEQIIHMLDEAAKTFTIVILKTNETIPYTSVFLNLNCAYWSDAAEKELRSAMRSGN